MLIELPVEQMKLYMSSFENLQSKVKEADDLITQSEQQQNKTGQSWVWKRELIF